jgi:hypothetical protein
MRAQFLPLPSIGVRCPETRYISNTSAKSLPIANTNGGFYFDNKVYITAVGNETWAGGVYSIDPDTYQTDIVVSFYFGVRLNEPDDVIWAISPP